ncbi:MAG: 2Fe-2S iron-sulfur cluster-binding protein, partial [Eggerthellaceae bacterium]|nr:2Fe-2S iron-sulfur cluster-binding protein [Eggerthellaceae bacterium]
MSLTITIDGKACACEPGEYLLDVAERNGIKIPTLCGFRPSLRGRGCCRVCIVEVVERGRSKTVVSCIYPVERECEVFTANEKILRERGVILALLVRQAPDSMMIKDMARLYPAPGLKRLEPRADGGLCVLCGLCVEACNSLGTGAIAAMSRGVEKEINTAYGVASDACIGCRSCANMCPTHNILTIEDYDTFTIWDKTFEQAHCEVCGEVIGTVDAV